MMKTIPRHTFSLEWAAEFAQSNKENLAGYLAASEAKPSFLSTIVNIAEGHAGALAALGGHTCEVARSLRIVGQASLAILKIGGQGSTNSGQVEVRIGDSTRLYQSGAINESLLNLERWYSAWNSSVIGRDFEAQRFLASYPWDELRRSSTRYDDFLYTYAEAFRSWSAPADVVQDLLERALQQSEPGAFQCATKDYVDYFASPQLQVLYNIFARDQQGFTGALAFALERHKKFYSRKQNVNNPSGNLATPLIALCSFATQAGLSIEIESDYIPPSLVHGLDRVLRPIDEEDYEVIDGLRSVVHPSFLSPLIEAYWEYSHPNQRRAIVEVLQDNYDPALEPIMRDVISLHPIDNDLRHANRRSARSNSGLRRKEEGKPEN